MTNNDILKQLTFDRDIIYQQLSSSTLSDKFAEEYESISSGETSVLSDDSEDIKEELETLKEDKSFDVGFQQKVNLIFTMNEADIITGFKENWIVFFDLMREKQVSEVGQAAFISYDAYVHPETNSLTLHGKKKYPEFIQPMYLPNTVYSDMLLTASDVFNFRTVWPDCEEYDWTLKHIDAYFDLQTLFRLNSRVLLHKTLLQLEAKGKINFLRQKPFYFYIAEHDMEVSMLYKL